MLYFNFECGFILEQTNEVEFETSSIARLV